MTKTTKVEFSLPDDCRKQHMPRSMNMMTMTTSPPIKNPPNYPVDAGHVSMIATSARKIASISAAKKG